MSSMVISRSDVCGMLAAMPPKARGRRTLERLACKLATGELAFERELEAALMANIAADPDMRGEVN